MFELLILGGGAALLLVLHFANKRDEAYMGEAFDVNDGIEPAVDGPVDIEALKKDPSKLDALRGKVTSVVYYSNPALNSESPVGESWLIDSNGATVEIDRRLTYDEEKMKLTSHRSDLPADKRNLEIEQNARWLADALDVPFQE